MKKYISILVLFLFLSGCQKTDTTKIVTKTETSKEDHEEEQFPAASEEAETEDKQGETQEDQAETRLRFVDVEGIEYETTINPNLNLHNYDWKYLKKEGEFYYYEDEFRSSSIGIDVSKYQPEIDWKQVKAAGAEFAFIRVGYRGYGQEGKIHLDQWFHHHIKAAKAAGIQVGVYFFSQAVTEAEAEEEAEFVLENLKEYDLEHPVVFDPEEIKEDTARTDNVPGEQFTKNAIAFCEKIKAAGYEPMIYSNMLWEAFILDLEQLQEYKIWYADYEPYPQTPYAFGYWQYTEKGRINGIDGIVDLNIHIK